ncbi:MAG: serine/threonine-protein kinase [Planctomycetia bacterium]|nr:serine/threonine-protein kinase [Planctomycetia bacterium]
MSREPLPPAVLKDYVPGLTSVEPCFAAGGFKWVYRAVVENRVEALKVLEMRRIDDPDEELAEAFLREQYARILREIEALGKCRVPDIVKLGRIAPIEFEVTGTHYLAYSEEFLDGSDLWQLIRSRREHPPLNEVVELFLSLLRCIDELWGRGYVHRDIKPGNIIKTGLADRPFVLLDLGIAFAVNEASLTTRPEDRLPLATYRYLAPEMMQPDFRNRIDYRTDLYTAGMTVYEYAAGRHPLAVDENDLMHTISRALRQPPTPLERHRPDLPVELRRLIDGMLKKKPALRPANLRMLFEKLEAMV